jgi:8-oxo-dGTP pyrophosphatase MutT (NUDIX family)
MTIATPRPAATVVVVRETEARAGFEVLMVRRHDQVAFMGGAYVFPGGRVETSELEHEQARGDELMAYRLAAVRELDEEAGVRVDPSALVPIAHWVTPEIETRRYDTRFFLVRMPGDQEPRHDQAETTELSWMTPHEAIERCERGEILLPPPTWTTLKRMRRHGNLAELFEWAAGVAIPRVQPHFIEHEQRTMLTLPGDPTYPTIDGWDVPEDTRFLLQDGRWRPVKS